MAAMQEMKKDMDRRFEDIDRRFEEDGENDKQFLSSLERNKEQVKKIVSQQ